MWKNKMCCLPPSMLIAQLMFIISSPPTVIRSTLRSARKDGEVSLTGGKLEPGTWDNSAWCSQFIMCILLFSEIYSYQMSIQFNCISYQPSSLYSLVFIFRGNGISTCVILPRVPLLWKRHWRIESNQTVQNSFKHCFGSNQKPSWY